MGTFPEYCENCREILLTSSVLTQLQNINNDLQNEADGVKRKLDSQLQKVEEIKKTIINNASGDMEEVQDILSPQDEEEDVEQYDDKGELVEDIVVEDPPAEENVDEEEYEDAMLSTEAADDYFTDNSNDVAGQQTTFQYGDGEGEGTTGSGLQEYEYEGSVSSFASSQDYSDTQSNKK